VSVLATGGAEPLSADLLYRRYASDVFALAFRAVGSRDDAEDVTQTTFLNAHNALIRGVSPTNERAWLLTIARNVCRGRFRTRMRSPHEEPLEESLLASHTENVESIAPAVDALRALPANQRTALVMWALEGRSKVEIGERFGLRAGAVDALLFRARSTLQEGLRSSDEPLCCVDVEAVVERQLAGAVDDHERKALRAHLRACPECASLARRVRARSRLRILLLPIDLLGRLAGLLGPAGVKLKLATGLGAALALGTTAVVTETRLRPERADVRPTQTARPLVVSPADSPRPTPSRAARAPSSASETASAGVPARSVAHPPRLPQDEAGNAPASTPESAATPATVPAPSPDPPSTAPAVPAAAAAQAAQAPEPALPEVSLPELPLPALPALDVPKVDLPVPPVEIPVPVPDVTDATSAVPLPELPTLPPVPPLP
jgi:RNA polymerase sigma factor (sigma-70 family)